MANHKSIAIGVLVAGLGLIGAAGAYLTWHDDQQQANTSDAAGIKETIRIGVDSWVGYFPLCSPEMQKRMYKNGYKLECISDDANYAVRYQKLEDQKLDLAVGTVDSYLINGEQAKWPGSIIAVLDESKGGDAVVAYEDEIKSLDDLKNNQNLSIAYTPDSPSHHLIKSLAVHFDIKRLQEADNWAIETNGSHDALAALKSGKARAAVLWEPEVSKALKIPGVKRVIGTESTQKLIVDVLIASRDFSQQNPEAIRGLLNAYFRTLRHYRTNEAELVSDLAGWTGLSKGENQQLLKGVAWKGLLANADLWFGLGDPMADVGLIDTIQSSRMVLETYAGTDAINLPDNDPYRLIYSAPMKQLFKILKSGGSLDDPGSQTANFKPLNDREWSDLQTVGTLKVRPVSFLSGSDSLSLEGKELLDDAAKSLKHYPTFRLMVAGHTSTQGDPEANAALSQDRSDAVARYLVNTHGIDRNRVGTKGFGGEQPLKREAGESLRAFRYRLPRVELVLKRDPI